MLMKIDDSYRLSPVQHGMVVHSLAAPQSGAYIQQIMSARREEPDIAAFELAWNQVLIARHRKGLPPG